MADSNAPHFPVDLVKKLLGGKFPRAKGFAWDEVDHFRFEGGNFEPYKGSEILPGPSLAVRCFQILDPTDSGSVTMPQGTYYFAKSDNNLLSPTYQIETRGGDTIKLGGEMTYELAHQIADLMNVARGAALMEGGVKEM